MDQAVPFQGASHVVALLDARASAQPDRLCYSFLAKGEVESERLTYAGLRRSAQDVAARLTERGARDARALLLYPPGLGFAKAFFGALYARTLAVPVLPPDPRAPGRTLARVRAVARDCDARFVLATRELVAAKPLFVAAAPELGALEWIATDGLPDADAGFAAPPIDPDTLAFLQYTSGSTASPRGVMVSHGNLLANCGLVKRVFEQGEHTTVVSWLPMYHDMGLIGCLIEPLYSGSPDYLLSPLDFLKHPVRWLAAIAKFRGTIAGAPNFAYELCCREIREEQSAGLDLSCWKVAFCGAEPVHAETLRRFAARFAGNGFRPESFYPCYGLAEATLIVTGGPKTAPPTVLLFDDEALKDHRLRPPRPGFETRSLVSCGRADTGQELLIVDPERLADLPAGHVGEIWLHGPSVARGYYGQPGKTRETFEATTRDGRGPFLRTGDLGFVHENELFICGRIKELIVVAGKNHYPQDIERTVHDSLPELRMGGVAAFSVENERREEVVVVVELGPRRLKDAAWQSQIVGTIRDAIAREHQLVVHDVVLARPRTIPRTSSGKLERLHCRSKYLARSIAPPS